MAGMTIWMLATLGFVPPLVVAVLLSCRGTVLNRLIAVQLTSALGSLLLVLMSFAFDQSAFLDLPLTLTLLTLPGTLVMALFLERWL